MDNRDIDTLMDYMNGLSIKELQDWILDLAEQNRDLRKERKKNKDIIEFQKNRIKRLKEQLTNAIIPKFQIGQEVYVIIQDIIRTTVINSFCVFDNNELSYYCKYVDGERMYLELDKGEIFATKEEAQVKLEEIKNG